MKKGLFIPIALVSLMTLVGCQKNSPKPSESTDPETSETSEPHTEESTGGESTEPVTYAVTITNKEALQAAWQVGEADRSLALTIAPEGNITALINSGEITFASSNEAVATVMGKNVHAVGAGEAKITVTYHDASDNVDLTISAKPTNKDKFGTVHEGTAEDPFDNEDALKAAKWFEENNGGKFTADRFYITGVVESFYHSPGSRTDKGCSWYLAPATEGGEKFEAYLVKKTDGSQWTVDDIWVGDTATFEGTFTKYNSQYETGDATIVSVNKLERDPQKTVNATVAEALTVGKALSDGMSTYDLYAVTGYVVLKDANGYYLADSKDADTSDLKNLFQIYKPTGLDNDLLKFAKVTVTNQLKNYHGQVETTLPVTKDSGTVTVLENGQPWVIPEHDATVAQALEVVNGLKDNETTVDLYNITAYVVAVTGAYSDKYGNMNFTIADAADGTDTITVFRAKTTAEVAAKVVAGAQVTVKGNLQKYVKDETVTPELLNVESITVIEQEVPELPILKGEGKTRVVGADAFVYIDNSGLKLTQEALAGVTLKIENFAVALSAQTPDENKAAAENYITGAATAVVLRETGPLEVAYINETEILMYVHMDKGLDASWKMQISFTLKAESALGNFESSLVFIGADLVDEGEGGQQTTEPLVLDDVSLLGYSGSNVAYATDVKEATVGGVKFNYQQIGAYGSGIQMRNKLSDNNNKTKSNFNNTTALPGAIASIEVEFVAGKNTKGANNCLKISYGTDETLASGSELLSFAADVYKQTSTPEVNNATFVKIEIDDAYTYTLYVKSITINFVA